MPPIAFAAASSESAGPTGANDRPGQIQFPTTASRLLSELEFVSKDAALCLDCTRRRRSLRSKIPSQHKALLLASPPWLILDISRLVYAAFFRTPTGVARVELAYAEYFMSRAPDRLRFVVVDALGRFRLLDRRVAEAFVRRIAAYWQNGIAIEFAHAKTAAVAHAIHTLLLLRPGASLQGFAERERCIYIVPSQLHLEKSSAIERLKKKGKLKLVYFVHDILPTLLPEYFEPGAEARTRRRMETAARLADLIIANSQSTATAFRDTFGKGISPDRIVAAPIGIALSRPSQRPESGAASSSYFVHIGTLEPRKNHLLLLNLWRTLRTTLGNSTPRLILVGGRGWENENAVDMLERSPSLRGFVEERGRVPDGQLPLLLSNARALLLPSFGEGFGMPLAEALALGAPAICSDIPAFREVGGSVPEYLDPLDGVAWRDMVIDYAMPGSLRRKSQLERLASWQAPTWQQHFAAIQMPLDKLAASLAP